MSCFKRRIIKQAKLLGANTYTSCFNFGQSLEKDEFDDHLLNHIPIVQISNVLQRLPHKLPLKTHLPDLQCKKVQSMVQQSPLSFKQSSTQSPINSCDNFQKYQDLNLYQSNLFSTQIEPVHDKTTFRCHSLRKYSTELQNNFDIPNFKTNEAKNQGKRILNNRFSLTKQTSLNSTNETHISCRKKYSHRELSKRITKQNSISSKYGQISPWRMETQESLF